MTDYRKLSPWHQQKVDKFILENVEPGHFKNDYNGFEWDEPEDTLQRVHSGTVCADCLMIYYNCLCAHSN